MQNKDYFIHESSYVDQPSQIGIGTKIWHFSHIMKNSIIGENCNIGQNHRNLLVRPPTAAEQEPTSQSFSQQIRCTPISVQLEKPVR